MDRIAAGTAEEIVIQSGATTYRPRAARWFAYAGVDEMQRLTEAARVVVSHAGAGSILMSLRAGKPLIVMPRRKRYHEHGDDHQVELAMALGEAGALLVAHEEEQLAAKLAEAETFRPSVGAAVALQAAIYATIIELCG
jgi:UDP-N-acetylglucosamine transferase subunit ALG13